MPDRAGAGLRVARSELLLGSDLDAQRAHAQRLAVAWLEAGAGRRVVFVDSARGAGRAGWPRALGAVEEPTELAHALGANSREDTMIVVDCLTLWLTASMMRAMQPDASDAYMAAGPPPAATTASLAEAVRACRGPLVIVGEASAGADRAGPADRIDDIDRAADEDAASAAASASASPRDARRLLEALGDLQQQAAAACERVSLVTHGQVLTLKDLDRRA